MIKPINTVRDLDKKCPSKREIRVPFRVPLFLGKLKNYIVLGPYYNLPNIYMACCPSYILPKTNKDNARSTLPKT